MERPRAERVVQQLYRDLFDREPERDVLRGLVEYLAEGRVSVRMQAMKMLKSEEFFDKRLRHKTPEDMARELIVSYLRASPSRTKRSKVQPTSWEISGSVQVDVMINSEEYLGRFGEHRRTEPMKCGSLGLRPAPQFWVHENER